MIDRYNMKKEKIELVEAVHKARLKSTRLLEENPEKMQHLMTLVMKETARQFNIPSNVQSGSVSPYYHFWVLL